MTCLVNNGGWYPWVICRAVALVDDVPDFRLLPDSYCQILRRLIKKVGKDDGQRAIYAKRQTIAQESGKSVETVYRALREFESKGWIEHREKRAREGLIGSDSEIVFTRSLCDLLALPYEGKVQDRTPSIQPSVADDRSNNAIGISFKQSSLKKQPAELSKLSTTQTAANTEATISKIVRIEGKSVPKELAWLVLERGLSLTGLFALMKRARANGKILSDVVECVSRYLSRLQGRDLFAYLNELVMLERDFAWEVKERRDKQVQQLHHETDRQRLAKATERLHGQWFISRKSGAILEVDGGWIRMLAFDESGQIRQSSKPIETAFIDAIEAGALVRCDNGSTPVLVSQNED